MAVRDTPFTHVPLPDGITYGSFSVAMDSLEAILRRAMGAWADSARWSRDSATIEFPDSLAVFVDGQGRPYRQVVLGRARRVPALRVWLTTASGGPDIYGALWSRGWREDENAGEQGTDDGAAFAMVCREIYCQVTTSWDVSSVGDSTIRGPGETLEMVCGPRPTDPRDPHRREH